MSLSIRFIFLIILLFYLNLLINGRRLRRVTIDDQEELEKAQRNAECCAKNMRCCVKTQPPPIEMRAILARCPNMGSKADRGTITRTMNKPVLAANEASLKNFQGFDEDEPLTQSRVTECRSKIVMTLKLHHRGSIVCKHQYIVVDHVYDPVSDKSVRLLNPYVIRLKQEPVSKSFNLKFIDYVNSEAREEVHNKQEANYTGCYNSRSHATCGHVKFDGKIIPYSQGFCCSCDAKKNLQRQPQSHDEKNEQVISYSDPSYLLDRVACPQRTFYSEAIGGEQIIDADEKNVFNITTQTTEVPLQKSTKSNVEVYTNEAPKENFRQGNYKGRWRYTTYGRPKPSKMYSSTTYRPSYLKRQLADDITSMEYLRRMSGRTTNKKHRKTKKSHVRERSADEIDVTRELFTRKLARKMRQTFPSGVQRRGGQNCADRFTPEGKDPDHYHESAHCLRFSKVWYGIYKLDEPSIEQLIQMNVYERYETASMVDKWREITNGTVVLGNRFPHYEDDVPSISMSFSSKNLADPEKYANWDTKRILIPEGVRQSEFAKYPEVRGGPDEYLVVQASRIAIEGEKCDSIGVGFEGFFNQPQRCARPRGSCLHNQPKQLWRNDKGLEQKNKRGCYFLKYHANITSDPLFVNESTGEKFLFVEYRGLHIAVIDLEIRADLNAVIKDATNAAITEVYVDATCKKYTLLTIKVINTGLVSSKFMVQLSDFPPELPEMFSKIRSKMFTIAPQSMHIYTLEMRAVLPTDLVYCSVEVLNKKKELVALRRVRIQKNDRCICAWYCLCACVASLTGLKCQPMSLEHYHAAGFEGALPIVTYMVHFTLLDDLLSVAFYFVVFLLGLLLLMGLFKALLGLCCSGIGIWGLPVILDLPKPMKRYYEWDLRQETLILYDQDGWPVNPHTFERVRNISTTTQFCSNVVFFFTYPLACCVIIFRRLCCPYHTRSQCAGAPGRFKDNEKEAKASCSACCKKKKKKPKYDEDHPHPCGDPRCKEELCVMRDRKTKKKRERRSKKERDRKEESSSPKTSGTYDKSQPKHKKDKGTVSNQGDVHDHEKPKEKKDKNDASTSPVTSATSSKTSKDVRDLDETTTTAAFTFNKYKSPFERVATIKPSTMDLNTHLSKQDETDSNDNDSEDSILLHIERRLAAAPKSGKKQLFKCVDVPVLQPSPRHSNSSESEPDVSQSMVQGEPSTSKPLERNPEERKRKTSESSSKSSNERDSSQTRSRSRTSMPTTSTSNDTSEVPTRHLILKETGTQSRLETLTTPESTSKTLHISRPKSL